VLQISGWTVQDVQEFLFIGSPTGLVVSIRDPSNIPPHANILIQALNMVGLATRGEHNNGVPEGEVQFLVGFKP